MKITKIIAICAMLVCGAFAANAQPGGFGGQQMDPSEMAKMRADRMKETLNLTNDQYTKVLDLYKKENEEMMRMFQQNQGGGQPDFSAMQKRREAQTAELKKILTEDQFKKYEEQQAQMRGGMGGPGQGGPGGRGQGGPGQGGPRQGGPRPR